MKSTYFITGISTDVGKTIVSAIIVEALQADYFKPIQAGELENSDCHKVKTYITNKKSKFHHSSFNLKTPMSPHAAAKIDGVTISSKLITRPTTKNNLVIEGAGGLLVPINNSETIVDIIKNTDKVIVVSRHYLGSINHTLLTIKMLQQKGLAIFGIIFSGKKHPSTETIIKKMAKVPILGRVNEETFFNKQVIKNYAEKFKNKL